MATVGELLSRLDAQVNGLRWTPEDTASSHMAGWIPLAKATAQAIAWLPLGGRSDQVKAGILNVLAPLARGPFKAVEDPAASPQLVDLATTVGAVSDSLAGILRWGPRPEQIGTPALALEAELLSAVHVVARWSRAVVEVQSPASRPPLAAFLGDLIVVTEPYALIPPQRRASTLEDLAFTTPFSPGLEGAVAAWAQTSGSILDDRYRVSGWALQVIAADLALISQAARRPFIAVGVVGPMNSAASSMATALSVAANSWTQAAAWPPHMRLGGQNPELRLSSRELGEGLTRSPVTSIAQARRLLASAVQIAAIHTHSMGGLVRTHQLWIHAPFLVPKVPFQHGWIREPRWSNEGRTLLLAAQSARNALDRAQAALEVAHMPDEVRDQRPRWASRAGVDVGAGPDEPTMPAEPRENLRPPVL